MAKYQLRKPDIDLAADARHRHIPGTSYHWKHGYIPLDARTATLFHKKKIAAELIKAGKVSIHEPEGVTHINSRGLRATRPLTIVPRTPDDRSPAPEVPKAPAVPAAKRAPRPKVVKAKVERTPYDALISPKSGDILMETKLVAYGEPNRYRFSGSSWVKEYPVVRGGAPTGDWRRLSTRALGDVRMLAKRGSIEGVEPDQIQAEIDKRHEAIAAVSLAAAHKLFGKEKVHGFTAVDGRTAAIRAQYGTMGSDGLLRDYVPEPGTVHLIHDNGTQVRIDATTAKKMKAGDAHRLAQVTQDVVTNYTHESLDPSSPITFHIDAKYLGNKNWKTTRNETLAYVRHGDTQNVHMSPGTAIRDTSPLTSEQVKRAGEHFTHGHFDLPTQAHGTLIHELGHVIDNREGHTGIGGRNQEAHQFHREVLPSGGLSLVPGARYARSSPHEGFAEAFTHAIATKHATELARNKARHEDEATKARRAAHDALAAKYEAKYGFFRRSAP